MNENETQAFKTKERRGHWEKAEKLCKVFICSECKYQTISLFNYCPNCGVKMKKGVDQWLI